MKNLLLIFSLILGGACSDKPPTYAEAPISRQKNDVKQSQLTYSVLLKATREANRGKREAAARLGFDLSGYNWTRDFSLGMPREGPRANHELRGVLISLFSRSYAFSFDSMGSLIAQIVAPGEILSFELFDFDGDGQDEIITRQKTGWGTGVYHEEFIIYGRSEAAQLSELWRGTSIWHADPLSDPARLEETEGFIKPGFRALLYVATVHKEGKWRTQRDKYVFDKARFRREQ